MSKKKIIGRFTEGDLDRLLSYICDYFQVHLDDLKGNSRMKKFATARKYCWKLLKQKGVTKKEIGKIFNRDHSTVVVALQDIDFAIDHYQENFIEWCKILKLNPEVIENNKTEALEKENRQLKELLKKTTEYSLPSYVKEKIKEVL
jgi:SOS response regulatory protein OraA/RecX